MTNIQRPVRADAVRNRARILEAARAEIATRGVEAGMDDIARTAGVAVGTLYRHFPTKTDLVSAVLAEYTEQITEDAEAALARVREGARVLPTMVRFLREVIRISAMNEAAKSAAPALGASADRDGSRAAAALASLIDAGIASGEVRADLTVADIYLLVSAAPLDQSDDTRERWAELVLPCLTAEAGRLGPMW